MTIKGYCVRSHPTIYCTCTNKPLPGCPIPSAVLYIFVSWKLATSDQSVLLTLAYITRNSCHFLGDLDSYNIHTGIINRNKLLVLVQRSIAYLFNIMPLFTKFLLFYNILHYIEPMERSCWKPINAM
jgi:hypothetical protein